MVKVMKMVKKATAEKAAKKADAPAPEPQKPELPKVGRPNDWRTKKYDSLASKGQIVVGEDGFWRSTATGEYFALP